MCQCIKVNLRSPKGPTTSIDRAHSWSKSGRLLASGSDDTYLNIWSYNPANLSVPFTLSTSVSTGHTANIFSVKFMPHSADRTVVTCAGDSEIRIFDLEYSGSVSVERGHGTDNTRSRRLNDFFPGCTWLSEHNTNARVYRSHADRAKRIVTESSPFLFLSCSEDGEVRQWDLRLPSSAYPAPRDSRRAGYRRRFSLDGTDPAHVPPPLISYKSYGIDLNTISCSASQPHYIALGGAHLHCFLHDRRMLGRNIDAESGRPAPNMPEAGTEADDSMREATRCVRRFAPNDRRRMRPRDHGHITACKISDARPNEMIASWSGDHIYSFDIVKSPDARERDEREDQQHHAMRARNRTERKRKRTHGTASVKSNYVDGRKLRKVPDEQAETGATAVQVAPRSERVANVTEVDRSEGEYDDLLVRMQRQSERIARAMTRLRKSMFDLSSTLSQISGSSADADEGAPSVPGASPLTSNTAAYSDALGHAAVLLPQMEDIISSWTYPVNPDDDEILLQNTLRRNRQSTWRFVQAAGCLARILGGRMQTTSSEQDLRLAQFETIKLAPREGNKIEDRQRFCLDFLKAIILWLRGGKEALLGGFKKPPDLRDHTRRFPLDDTDTTSTVAARLRDYLLPLASEDAPIVDLGTNRFERDELRQLFQDQKTAVQAFTRAVDSIEELRDHQGTSDIVQTGPRGERKRVMDRGAATRFWGEKVGRQLVLDAGRGITFDFVDRAFGGFEHAEGTEDDIHSLAREGDEESGDAPHITIEEASEAEVDDGDDNDHEQSDAELSSSEDESESPFPRRAAHPFSPHSRLSTLRAACNSTIPYTSHTKVYKGHCNTRTVKDVNYYGLDDEYVVSGSDDGHFFIWDRTTSEIINVLEGDGEVVNVVQGHPYEPLIAVSGIDSTVKIFGQSGEAGMLSRERFKAVKGLEIANPGGGRHSTLAMGFGIGHRRRAAQRRANEEGDSGDVDDGDTDQASPAAVKHEQFEVDEKVVRGGLRSRRAMDRVYQITSQNNAERQRGVGDAFMTVSLEDLEELDEEAQQLFLRAWILRHARALV